LLRAQLEFGNKWSEIAKKLQGRGENSVKNRYNMLHKKYRDEIKMSYTRDMDHALQAMNGKQADDNEWVVSVLEEKRKKRISIALME
jgi:hypothetical protein